MPFKKIASGSNKGKYRSPLGHVLSGAQVRAYYAKKTAEKKVKKKQR